MAATLLEIKSKSLLPKIEDLAGDIEDNEQALIRQLEEYKLFKEASEKLKEQENVLRFYKEPDKSVGDVKIVYSDFNLDGLIAAFSKLLLRVDDKRRQENVLKEIPKEIFTVKDKVNEIRTVLLDRKSVSFFEMFSSYYTKNELITTFQAMLELLKLQYIAVEQNGTFEDITLTLIKCFCLWKSLRILKKRNLKGKFTSMMILLNFFLPKMIYDSSVYGKLYTTVD